MRRGLSTTRRAEATVRRRGLSTSRGRGFGNAAPVNGREGGLQLTSWKKGEQAGAQVRVCETPEYYDLHGCPHGR